jgi:hypothetical protein
MRRKILFNMSLLIVILGLIVELTYPATAVTLQQVSTETSTLNDLQALKAKYPQAFKPDWTYVEFVSQDLATLPQMEPTPNGTFTFRNAIVAYRFVAGLYAPNGSIVWTYVQTEPNMGILVLATYLPQTLFVHQYLSAQYSTAFITPQFHGTFGHVYLFLAGATSS